MPDANEIKRAVLERCITASPISDLVDQIAPKATFYAQVRILIRDKHLERISKDRYLTTQSGTKLLESLAAAGNIQDRHKIFASLYPPSEKIPGETYKAMFELVVCASVARKHDVNLEHHPSFVVFGKPLTWKSSFGKMALHATGADALRNFIDLSTESARSIWIRRSTDYEREILKSPVVVFDDFLHADKETRRFAEIYMSGSKKVSFENTILEMLPVPILTLNPARNGKDPSTKPELPLSQSKLEQMTTLSVGLLRRCVLCDIDNADVPDDLSSLGDAPLEAARTCSSLGLPKPRTDCSIYRSEVVLLVQTLLIKDAFPLVDVDILLNLATGMTAFIPESRDAVKQVLYDYFLVVQTLGWTVPNWWSKLDGAGLAGSSSYSHALTERYASSREDGGDSEEQKNEKTESLVPTLVLSASDKEMLSIAALKLGKPVSESVRLYWDFVNSDLPKYDGYDQLRQLLDFVRNEAPKYGGVEKLTQLHKFHDDAVQKHGPGVLRRLELLGETDLADLEAKRERAKRETEEALAESKLTREKVDMVNALVPEALREAGLDDTGIKALKQEIRRAGSLQGAIKELHEEEEIERTSANALRKCAQDANLEFKGKVKLLDEARRELSSVKAEAARQKRESEEARRRAEAELAGKRRELEGLGSQIASRKEYVVLLDALRKLFIDNEHLTPEELDRVSDDLKWIARIKRGEAERLKPYEERLKEETIERVRKMIIGSKILRLVKQEDFDAPMPTSEEAVSVFFE